MHGFKLHCLPLAILNNAMECDMHRSAMHWNYIEAYDKHSCTIHYIALLIVSRLVQRIRIALIISIIRQCIGVKLFILEANMKNTLECNHVISHVLQCIGIILLMISIVVQCIGKGLCQNGFCFFNKPLLAWIQSKMEKWTWHG